MQTVYGGNRDLNPDDLDERRKLLDKYKFSVIIEGGHMEFDNLDKWITQNLGTHPIESIYYGKTDYDYGFAEFFLSEKTDEERLRNAVPNIYTTYADSYPPGKICKSNGSGSDIDYLISDTDAIVFP